jgi:predicted unusual protein kinase regulating ubiquinone biosynthesis (AarF/ABC1/UbiB family)
MDDMRLAPRYLKRYRDIGLLLAKYGEARATSRFRLETSSRGTNGNGSHRAEELPDDLERLGPTFVKLGQLLSSRPDLVPADYLKPLTRLQDKVRPFPFEQVQHIVESELGARLNKAFSQFEREPLAAASLGQVHKAALHDGRPVVVKVQRPDIARQIEEDFDALEEIARFLGRHTKLGQRYQFERLLEEFENTLASELDYEREASNMLALGRNLAAFEHIRIPQPVRDYTTGKVLTMDYIEGVKITGLSPLARLETDHGALAEELFRAYLHQILVDGMFHADPHPGNIFLTRDHKVALLDLGMVGHTTPGMREGLLKLLLAVSEGASDDAADVAVRIGNPGRSFDESTFRQRIGQLVAKQQNATLSQMDIGKVILEVSRCAADTSLFVPTELSLLGKTLLQLDEVGRCLDPDFDPNESVRRNASRILNERLKSTFTEARMYSNLLETKEFLGALPTRLNKILDAVGNAELNVNVKPGETEFLIDSARKVANRITTGLILASLIVGAALLMQVQTRFQIFGYPGLAIICFLAAATGGSWLVLSILWQDHKSKRASRK